LGFWRTDKRDKTLVQIVPVYARNRAFVGRLKITKALHEVIHVFWGVAFEIRYVKCRIMRPIPPINVVDLPQGSISTCHYTRPGNLVLVVIPRNACRAEDWIRTIIPLARGQIVSPFQVDDIAKPFW